MDSLILRCNIIRCRTHLEHRAVVTTCSHIFCPACAEAHGLLPPNLNPSSGASVQRGSTSHTHLLNTRVCPACRSSLVAPDDAVLTTLNPSEDYKTSLLSGLSPNLIMEIAGRGLAFWGYQAMQEVLFQETFSRNLNEKYITLNGQLDKLVHDANSEIGSLRHKLEQMTIERGSMERKCMELGEAFREKSRKCLQFQDLYDKLKRKMMLANVQNAANETVENLVLGGGGIMGHEASHNPDMGVGIDGGMRQTRFGGIENPITIDDLNNASDVINIRGAGSSQGAGGVFGVGIRGVHPTAGVTGVRGMGNNRNTGFMDIDTTPSSTPRPQPGVGNGVRGGGNGGVNFNTQGTPHRQRLISTPGLNTNHHQSQYNRENFFSFGNPNTGGGSGLGADKRQPLMGLNENSLGIGGRLGGHVGGLSAGVRIGRPQGAGAGGGSGMMGGGHGGGMGGGGVRIGIGGKH